MQHKRWWTRDIPTVEGWYFWKRNKNALPENWGTRYVDERRLKDRVWRAWYERGGWWSFIPPEKN